ncbi:unnamed protein product [Choristocarpus tenellus]
MSPVLTMEELEKALCDTWHTLSEDQKTPYKLMASDEMMQCAAVDAAVVLAQVSQ